MPASWKTARVFISSTFKDMQAERDWLVRFVFPKLREELLKHRIHLVDVDLRWGVTSDQNSLGVCREVIDHCHPRFMGILGGRYGWMPDGKDKSITADEVHYGVLDREAAKRGRAFFYFRKDEDTLAIPEDDARSGGYREFALLEEIERFGLERAEAMAKERTDKLAVLKQAIIDAELPAHHYEAKWSDMEKRLIGLEKFGERVHEDLLQSLKADPDLAAHFTDDNTATPDEFAEERDQMEAFIEERVDQYILGSREPLMNEMLAFANTEGTPNILVLTGAPGSGKSALLAHFTRELAKGRALSPLSAASDDRRVEDNAPYLIIPHFVGASTDSTDLRRTLRRFCHELAKAAGNTEPLPLDIKDLITHFQKLLSEAAAKQRVIIIFDAFNQLDQTDGAHWMNWLPRELPSGVRVIASVIAPVEGQKEHQTLAILRNRQDARVEALKPLDENDTQAIIEGYLKRYSKRLSPEQIAALKAKPASNLPLYILTALEELRTLGTYEEITDRIRTLSGDARALFGWILTERLARDPGFRDRAGQPCGAALVEKFAACLGVSRHGLSPAELTALLDPGDQLGNVAALLRLLRPYLMRRGELLDFYHGQFRQAAGTAYLDTPEKQRAAHQSVATCLHAFADPHRDGQCRDATPHALSELPHHQTRAEAWPDLIATLENIFFLESKVTHGMAFDLAEDFTAAADALPPEHAERQRLRLLDEALCRDIHFIARHAHDYPQALFQSLWNSVWWYDCPEVAAHSHTNDKSLPVIESKRGKLYELLESWRTAKEASSPNFCWLRSVRPPRMPLGDAQEAVIYGHNDTVSCVAYSPDNAWIVSGSVDGTLQIWNAVNFKEMRRLIGHYGAVTSVSVSPDGQRIVSGSNDSTVRVWDSVSGAQMRCYDSLNSNENPTCLAALAFTGGAKIGVAFGPSGDEIAFTTARGSVELWNLLSGVVPCPSRPLRFLSERATSVAFSRCRIVGIGFRQYLESWCEGGVTLVNVATGEEKLLRYCGAQSIAFSPDGMSIAGGGDDGVVTVWDTCKMTMICALKGHTSGVTSVAFSTNGRLIASGSIDRTVRVWDVQKGVEIACFDGHDGLVNCVCFSPNGQQVVSTSSDKSVRIWKIARDVLPRPIKDDGIYITEVAGSPAGQLIAAWSAQERKLMIWDSQGCSLSSLDVSHNFSEVHFSPDAKQIELRRLEIFTVFDVIGGVALPSSSTASRTSMSAQGICLSEDYQHIAIGGEIKDRATSETLAKLSDPDLIEGRDRIEAFIVCAGSRRILERRLGGLGEFRLWDTVTGQPIGTKMRCGGRLSNVAFSPNGSYITMGDFWDVIVWDALTGEQKYAFNLKGERVNRVAFSPSGNLVACSSWEKYLHFWDIESGTKVVCHPDIGDCDEFAISEDGRYVVCKEALYGIFVYDLDTGKCLEFYRFGREVNEVVRMLATPLLASIGDTETTIKSNRSSKLAAHIPVPLECFTSLCDGRVWAGAQHVARYLNIFSLEGSISDDSEEQRSGEKPDSPV